VVGNWPKLAGSLPQPQSAVVSGFTDDPRNRTAFCCGSRLLQKPYTRSAGKKGREVLDKSIEREMKMLIKVGCQIEFTYPNPTADC